MSYHIEVIPNRNYRPTTLLRKDWREGKKAKRKTIANLSDFPPSVIEGIIAAIKGEVIYSDLLKAFHQKIFTSWAYSLHFGIGQKTEVRLTSL